jgi:hypothetical protein
VPSKDVVDNICCLMHIMEMAWEVLFHHEFEPEFDALPAAVADELLAHAKLLAHFGPSSAGPESTR